MRMLHRAGATLSAFIAATLILAGGGGISSANAEETPATQSTDNGVSQQSWNPPSDATIHDSLTGDDAKITDVSTVSKTTGTAPFDKDDNPGDDSSVGNSIVRSYDSLNYTISYTMASKNSKDYYKDARLTLPWLKPRDSCELGLLALGR